MSPSPLPPKVSKPAKGPVVLVDVERYREVVYHDGRGRFTSGSRRRSRVVNWVESTSTHHRPSKDLPDLSSRLFDTSGTSMGDWSSGLDASQTTAPLLDSRHVTRTKRASRSRSKVIIEQEIPDEASKNISGLSRCFKNLQEPSRYYGVELPTPPTPRIKRLPTPELLDVEGRPFCNCSTQKYVVEYCTTCRQELGPCSVYE